MLSNDCISRASFQFSGALQVLVSNDDSPFPHLLAPGDAVLQERHPAGADGRHPHASFIACLEKSPCPPFPPRCRVKPKGVGKSEARWVGSVGELQRLVRELEGVGEVALDVEHNASRSYLGLTCLLQLSTGLNPPANRYSTNSPAVGMIVLESTHCSMTRNSPLRQQWPCDGQLFLEFEGSACHRGGGLCGGHSGAA